MSKGISAAKSTRRGRSTTARRSTTPKRGAGARAATRVKRASAPGGGGGGSAKKSTRMELRKQALRLDKQYWKARNAGDTAKAASIWKRLAPIDRYRNILE